MTSHVQPRQNRPFAWRTCHNHECQRDAFWLSSESPPYSCGWCQQPYEYEDRTPLVARIAWFAMWTLGAILVAVLVLNAVR